MSGRARSRARIDKKLLFMSTNMSAVAMSWSFGASPRTWTTAERWMEQGDRRRCPGVHPTVHRPRGKAERSLGVFRAPTAIHQATTSPNAELSPSLPMEIGGPRRRLRCYLSPQSAPASLSSSQFFRGIFYRAPWYRSATAVASGLQNSVIAFRPAVRSA